MSNTTSTLNSLFKQQYAQAFEELVYGSSVRLDLASSLFSHYGLCVSKSSRSPMNDYSSIKVHKDSGASVWNHEHMWKIIL